MGGEKESMYMYFTGFVDYKKMWEELKREYGKVLFKRKSQKDTIRYDIELNILMDSYKQKYTYNKGGEFEP